MICDPPYNTFDIVEHSKSEYTRILLLDMSSFAQLLSGVRHFGAHMHLLCSALQFKLWYKLLVYEMEAFVRNEREMEGEEVSSLITTVFEA